MRKWITFLMTLLVGSVSYVNAYGGSEVTFEAGYRRDDLDWSLQVPSCDPIFKITSKFEDIDIFQVGVRAKSNVGCNLYVRGAASWGWILDGDFEESFKVFVSPISAFDTIDEIEFATHSENIIDDKFVVDFSVALGYPCYFCDCTMYIAPVIGYGFNEQNIHIEDNEGIEFFSFDSEFFPGSTSECCDEKHVFRWYGPFVGVDFGYQPCGECWDLWAQLEYHFGHFKSKRHDFVGFSEFDDFDSTSRHAHGWVFAAGADYDFCNCWSLGFSVKYQDWSATRHHHHCHDSEFESFFGTSDDEIKVHADWRSFLIAIAVGYGF